MSEIKINVDLDLETGKAKSQLDDFKKSVKDELKEGNFTKEDLIRIFRDMTICREFEDMLNQIKTQAKYADVETTYPGPAHLSLGQEAAAVGQAYLLGKEDFTFGSHRSHSEILAKSLSCIEKLSDEELMEDMKNFFDGATLNGILQDSKAGDDVKELAIEFILYGALSELFARENGFHKGLGGSMHAFFLPFGVYPNNALVGGSATITTGAALFKKVNDTYGHAAGDEVLRQVAYTIKEQLRESDIPARYGGEEFVVILPETDKKDACVIAERIRKNVANIVVKVNETQDLSPTISMGVAQYTTDGKEAKELINAADTALYHSKHNGKNMVSTYEADGCRKVEQINIDLNTQQ